MQETQLIHWKLNQLKFSIKIVFLSPDELTMVQYKKVIYYSTKVGGRAFPPQKKVWGIEVPPAHPLPPPMGDKHCEALHFK